MHQIVCFFGKSITIGTADNYKLNPSKSVVLWISECYDSKAASVFDYLVLSQSLSKMDGQCSINMELVMLVAVALQISVQLVTCELIQLPNDSQCYKSGAPFHFSSPCVDLEKVISYSWYSFRFRNINFVVEYFPASSVFDRGKRKSAIQYLDITIYVAQNGYIPPKLLWSVVQVLAVDTNGLACSSNCASFQSALYPIMCQCNHVSDKGTNGYSLVFSTFELAAAPMILLSVSFHSTTSKISRGQVAKLPKPPWLSCHELMPGLDVTILLEDACPAFYIIWMVNIILINHKIGFMQFWKQGTDAQLRSKPWPPPIPIEFIKGFRLYPWLFSVYGCLLSYSLEQAITALAGLHYRFNIMVIKRLSSLGASCS
jgi:hypothetical protein